MRVAGAKVTEVVEGHAVWRLQEREPGPLQCRCRSSSRGLDGITVIVHVKVREVALDPTTREGEINVSVECTDDATQEDGLCDWCRAGHPENEEAPRP